MYDGKQNIALIGGVTNGYQILLIVSISLKILMTKFFIPHIRSPASWSSGNVFVSGAGGLRFKYRAGQIKHSVANGSPPLRHFLERSCVARAQ